MNHQTDVEAILSMILNDPKGIAYHSAKNKMHAGKKGIYASLISKKMHSSYLNASPTIHIGLDYIDSIQKKFIINKGWEYGDITESTYQLEKGKDELSHFLNELSDQNNSDSEIVFGDERIDLKFFESISIDEFARNYIIEKLRDNGVVKINNKNLEDFFTLSVPRDLFKVVNTESYLQFKNSARKKVDNFSSLPVGTPIFFKRVDSTNVQITNDFGYFLSGDAKEMRVLTSRGFGSFLSSNDRMIDIESGIGIQAINVLNFKDRKVRVLDSYLGRHVHFLLRSPNGSSGNAVSGKLMKFATGSTEVLGLELQSGFNVLFRNDEVLIDSEVFFRDVNPGNIPNAPLPNRNLKTDAKGFLVYEEWIIEVPVHAREKNPLGFRTSLTTSEFE